MEDEIRFNWKIGTSHIPNGKKKWCGSPHEDPPASLESRRRSCSIRQDLRAGPVLLVPEIQSPAYDTDRTVVAPRLLLPDNEDNNIFCRFGHLPPHWNSTSYARKSLRYPGSVALCRYHH